MKRTRVAALAVTAAAAAITLAACGSTHATVSPAAATPPPATTQQPDTTAPATPPPDTQDTFGLTLGDTITMTDDSTGAEWDVTLNSVRPFTPGQYDDPPPAGQHYIVIDVTYSATTGPVDVNEWDWTAKDPTGLVSDVQSVTSPNGLSATTIQTGSKIRGTVVLAVTDGSGGTVVYSAGGAERGSWKFTAAQA